MSIKKELLCELSDEQLKELANFKGITLNLTKSQKRYYNGWDERDKLIDLMNDNREVTISDVENLIIGK